MHALSWLPFTACFEPGLIVQPFMLSRVRYVMEIERDNNDFSSL